MGTKIGIVYATNSKMVLRAIIPDSDDELAHPTHLLPGESMHIVDRDTVSHQNHLYEHIHRLTGVKSPEPRCAVVDPAGNVVDVILADAEIHSHPIEGHTLVNHPYVRHGDVHRGNGVFVRPPRAPVQFDPTPAEVMLSAPMARRAGDPVYRGPGMQTIEDLPAVSREQAPVDPNEQIGDPPGQGAILITYTPRVIATLISKGKGFVYD